MSLVKTALHEQINVSCVDHLVRSTCNHSHTFSTTYFSAIWIVSGFGVGFPSIA